MKNRRNGCYKTSFPQYVTSKNAISKSTDGIFNRCECTLNDAKVGDNTFYYNDRLILALNF